MIELRTIQLPVQVSIRALQAVNDSVVWFAANKGVLVLQRWWKQLAYRLCFAVDGKYLSSDL